MDRVRGIREARHSDPRNHHPRHLSTGPLRSIRRNALGLFVVGSAIATLAVFLSSFSSFKSDERSVPPGFLVIPSPSGSPVRQQTPPGPSITRSISPTVQTKSPRIPDRSVPPAKPRPVPRLVGPKDRNEFTNFLSSFCQRRGDRLAAFIAEGANPASGDWACIRDVTFTRINLTEACRDSFGYLSQARQILRGDSRTWRCHDS
jgi:hypothetical protein